MRERQRDTELYKEITLENRFDGDLNEEEKNSGKDSDRWILRKS